MSRDFCISFLSCRLALRRKQDGTRACRLRNSAVCRLSEVFSVTDPYYFRSSPRRYFPMGFQSRANTSSVMTVLGSI